MSAFYRQSTSDGDVLWLLPDGWTGDRVGRCRSCEAEVLWATTPAGKPAPVNRDGVSHFATCPQADRWRRSKRIEQRVAESAPIAPALHPDDGHAHAWSCRLCGVDFRGGQDR